MSRSSKDYEVGYGRPPKATQFQPGQSGNRKGRPKGSHNLHTLLNDELQSRVPIVINGRTVRLSKAEIAIRQQVDKAAKGDLRAFTILMKLMDRVPPAPASGDDGPSQPSETELTPDQFSEILASIARDHRGDVDQ